MIESILSGDSKSLSSKRLIGVLGCLVVLTLLIYVTIQGRELPGDALPIFGFCCGLLGWDKCMSVFKKD